MSYQRVTTQITQTGTTDRPWCLRWQTSVMPAPAFWYFATREQAEEAERRLR